jgi:hypothetical protein
LPLVVGGGGTGANGQSVTPFIEIPTSRNEFESMGGGSSGAANAGNTTSSSSGLAGGSIGLQSVLNNTVLSNEAS